MANISVHCASEGTALIRRQSPISRMSLTFDAVLETASQIGHARRNDDAGKQARKFLDWVSDESALQMAMLADAADQVLVLVRRNDASNPDPARHAAWVHSFLLDGDTVLA